jgi:hypothetical protein
MANPILVTGAAGRAGGIGRTVTELLLQKAKQCVPWCEMRTSVRIVDFAGSRGMVNLSAETEINLKMTAPRFDGALLAWAQRPVRLLVPPGFATPFQAVVNRPRNFVCRAGFCSKVKQNKNNGLYVFTYAGDGSSAPERFHLRSEQSTVVVDTSSEPRSSL